MLGRPGDQYRPGQGCAPGEQIHGAGWYRCDVSGFDRDVDEQVVPRLACDVGAREQRPRLRCEGDDDLLPGPVCVFAAVGRCWPCEQRDPAGAARPGHPVQPALHGVAGRGRCHGDAGLPAGDRGQRPCGKRQAGGGQQPSAEQGRLSDRDRCAELTGGSEHRGGFQQAPAGAARRLVY